MFDFSNYSAKWKYYDDSNVLVFGKMKYKMGGVRIGEFVRLKPKIYSILVNIKKAKGVSKNVAPKVNHNECKDVLKMFKTFNFQAKVLQ